MARNTESTDLNRDPISGAPGSHPVGVGMGGIAGAAAGGALAGTVFGPIGTLVGAAVGTVAGAAAGKGIAERVDPTAETEYWREAHAQRPYHDNTRDFDRDYASAYSLGLSAREREPALDWNDAEPNLRNEWETARGTSTLAWDDARPAVRDAWDRTDRTLQTYAWSDEYFGNRFDPARYADSGETFDDYRPAYRYGTYARHNYAGRDWDDSLDSELESGWERFKGASRLNWERAKHAVKEAFDLDDRRPH